MTSVDTLSVILQGGGIIPKGTRVNVFQEIYWVFLGLGTLVGIVVISYMLWNAYKYRDTGDPDTEGDRPQLGELPSGGGKGRKLFLSFALSAIIVISLIVWTYGTLLYVENPANNAADQQQQAIDEMNVTVVGYQFGWRFVYPNGHTSDGTLRVPQDTRIWLSVTSDDVFHNFGIPALSVKTDSIPGQTTETWFIADETGTYMAQCYELCGAGHSYMSAEVVVMEESAYEEWYSNTTSPNASSTPTPTPTNSSA